MGKYSIFRAISLEDSHYQAIKKLLQQLTTRDVKFSVEEYIKQLESPNSPLFLLSDNNNVIGMLTIGLYFSPTGSKAWIEDVVIDNAYRGCGLGKKLVSYAIDYCKSQGIETLMLTSNPSRIAANSLYCTLGFKIKETNVYKMNL